MKQNILLGQLLVACGFGIAGTAGAQVVVSDNFTVGANQTSWTATGTACLTADPTASKLPAGITKLTTGAIPTCSLTGQAGGYGDATYPKGYLANGHYDPNGNGALRLTNAAGSVAGAILYNSTFPSNAGIAITFTSVSYDGNSYGGADGGTNGADGMSFFLLDASAATTTSGGTVSFNNGGNVIGQYGGSLGYSCAQGKGAGAMGGYVGLGIDEYGNFLNKGDNTATGVANTNGVAGQFQGNRIGLRGAGNINWTQLNANFPNYYPSSTANQLQAVENTCSTGTLWDYSKTTPVNTGKTSYNGVSLLDYAPISYTNNGTTSVASTVLSVPIATENAGARNAYTGSNSSTTSIGGTFYTYNLKITSNGLLSLSYVSSAAPNVTTQVATNWPITGSNGAMPTNFTFGFAASTGGGTNVHEITCFQAAPAEDTDSSAAVNAVQSGTVKTNTAVYVAFYHSHGWWGQLVSTPLSYNPSTGAVGLNGTANWDASCELTGDTTGTTLPGNKCAATGATTDTAQTPANRVMLSYDNVAGKGVPFEWTNGLNSNQLAALNAGDSNGQIRLAFLRGDRSQEVNSSGTGPFRVRVSVLGDVMDSSPVWQGPPSQNYPNGSWSDYLYPSTSMPESAATYGAYQTAQSTRLNVVYAGSNDGFVHGFEAGSYDATSGGVTTANNDGKEVIAYMPNAVVSTIHNSTVSTADYSSPNYGHNYFVDATPATGDLFYAGAWHTWLVGGLGAGGSAVYALDVTNPANFKESNAASLVIGEWDTNTSALGTNLGQTFGTPQIGRFHDGKWGFLFGNGYQAASHNGGVFIGLVDQTSGAVSFKFLGLPATANGTSTNPNGIIAVNGVDLDGDGIIDYIYAGDLLGNVWRWDVTSQTESNWTTVVGSGSTTQPVLLFSAGSTQPISTQVQVGAVQNANGHGYARLMVDFGTGEQMTALAGTQYAKGQQALYGIWDGNVSAWNSKSTVSTFYEPYPSSVSSTTITQPYTVKASSLQAQTDIASSVAADYTGTNATLNNGETVIYRTFTQNSVCYADGALVSTASNPTACANYTQFGWTYALPIPASAPTPTSGDTLEQVVFNPVITSGVFVVNSYIVAANQACSTTNPTGWTMALDPASGGALPVTAFPNNSSINITGFQSGAVGSPNFVNTGGGDYLVTNTSNSTNSSTNAQLFQFHGNTGLGVRLNWVQLR